MHMDTPLLDIVLKIYELLGDKIYGNNGMFYGNTNSCHNTFPN